jgi:hypothetical protein
MPVNVLIKVYWTFDKDNVIKIIAVILKIGLKMKPLFLKWKYEHACLKLLCKVLCCLQWTVFEAYN